MEAQTTANKKSEKLTKPEKKALKEYRKSFDNDTKCAISLGISREVLIRVSWAGSGSPETIQQIRSVLKGVESKTENENILTA